MTEPTVSDEVKQFYRSNPYPSYGNAVKTKPGNVYAKYCTNPGKYLEAGCGTGHVVAGSALILPNLDFYAIDFSDESMEVAKKVADAHNVKINFQQAT